ncbi:ankyrin repeat domain-containing protein [Candidatus Mesenet endosymbiont of Agriotes lineatus]|uniref:ankyrin repeat domain-containing protein n=1 Tax=Candidatus Mesenet endosymbiont of Agriotes lineatus TaxID=3077948 RepID=UPI0030D2FFB8
MTLKDMIFYAVRYGYEASVTELLKLICGDVNIKDDKGHTPLHKAVLYQHCNLIRVLIELGAKVNTKGVYGWTPLHSAVLTHNLEMVSTLLELRTPKCKKDEDGNLPIHLAAELGYLEITGVLCDKNTVNAINFFGSTPLHLAAIKGHIEVAKILYGSGANIDKQDKKGNTALIIATKNNHTPLVRFLLQRGADYNRTNYAGQTFNAFAATEEMKNIVCKYDKSSNISVDVGLPILKSSTCKRKRHSSTSSESSNLLDSLPRSTLSSPQYKCSNSPNMI